MKSLRTFWPFLILLASLTLIWQLRMLITPRSVAPLQQAKDPILTPTSAAQIAQERFPDSEIQTILLEDNGEAYNYLVTVQTPDQGCYQLYIALSDGQIYKIAATDTPNPHSLPLTVIAQQLKDDYPAAQILSLELHNDEQFTYYQAELQQDHTLVTVLLQPTDGTILTEQLTPAADPASYPRTNFNQILTQAAAIFPSRQLIGLSLSSTGAYQAFYQDENYHYTLSFDHQGMEIGRITSQRSDFDPRLPQSNIAPAE